MDLENLLIWNVRGLNKKSHRDAVRTIIDDYQPAVVCLQEMKIQHLSSRILLSTLGSELDQHLALPATEPGEGCSLLGAGHADRSLPLEWILTQLPCFFNH